MEAEAADNSLNYSWNDNASMQRRPKNRPFRSSSPIYSQRMYEGKSSRPCFYEHKKSKTGDKRKAQRSRRQRIRMSPNESDSDLTMWYRNPNGQSLKGEVSPVKYRYRNANTNTNAN